MDAKPSTLFLIAIAGVGTALLSPLNVNGTPVIVLAIPFAIAASILYNAEKGIVVGVGASALGGALTSGIDFWGTISFALAAVITVLAYDAIYPKQKNEWSALLFAVLGTLVYEFIRELSTRENILFRPELFLGTTPVLGLQILANAVVTGLLLSHYAAGKK